MNNAWLAHHGILGQKWGVRRFQNADGTYTDAGKKRYRSNKEAATERNKEYDKNRTTMSDKDLDSAINRLKKENELHRLARPGQAFIDGIMSDVGKRVITTAATGALIFGAKAFIDGVGNKTGKPIFKDLANAVFNGGAKKK